MSKTMKLFAFDCGAPAHMSAGLWKHPQDRGHEYKSVKYWVEYAKLLEKACFDGIFFAHADGYHDVYKGSVAESLKDAAQIPIHEPSYLIPAMASVTTHLGFGVTASTAYNHPYKLAQNFATLDHLTDGRVAWNLVTSYAKSAAKNLGNGELRAHDLRYEHAEEFLDVALKLWEGSWEDDAVELDVDQSIYVNPTKVHEIQHDGQFFKVPGIFMCEPSKQRTPVISQAGGSSKGVALAAATAEVVFMSVSTKHALKKSIDTLRAKALECGRDPESIAVVQLVTVITDVSDEAAQKRYQEYQKLVSYHGGLARYSGWAGIDMGSFEEDKPLPYIETQQIQTMIDYFLKMDPSKQWTPQDIGEYMGIGGTSPVIVGGPETVANELLDWMAETGVNGFNLAPAVKFEDIKNFAENVVPVLQQKGAFRTEYEGTTLRENLFGKGRVRLADDHPGVKYRKTTEKKITSSQLEAESAIAVELI
ncbi:LLM class flavin-dependent oxidoreductase [Acinetobacter sp.]|uniref:LLM class flavin-dependent oxidoreductase n=1 Tax=Acinetobacter sp. TaxID=472 RepID=UPI0031E49624